MLDLNPDSINFDFDSGSDSELELYSDSIASKHEKEKQVENPRTGPWKLHCIVEKKNCPA